MIKTLLLKSVTSHELFGTYYIVKLCINMGVDKDTCQN